jgi:opacity protein-like surface antigen
MFRRCFAMSVFFMLAAGVVSAVEPTNHGHTGGYFGVNGSYSFDNSKDLAGAQTFDSGGASAWLGYRIGQVVGLELQGEWQNGLKEIDGWSLIANLNWYPLQYWRPGEFIQPFLVTGVGIIVANLRPGKSTDLNGAFRLGGGVDFYVHEHWSIRLKGEWVTGVGRLSDVRYAPISLGVQYVW